MPAAEINPDKVFLKIGVAFLNNSGIVFVYLICSFEYYMLFYQFLHCCVINCHNDPSLMNRS
jgi:hypothetical protein